MQCRGIRSSQINPGADGEAPCSPGNPAPRPDQRHRPAAHQRSGDAGRRSDRHDAPPRQATVGRDERRLGQGSFTGYRGQPRLGRDRRSDADGARRTPAIRRGLYRRRDPKVWSGNSTPIPDVHAPGTSFEALWPDVGERLRQHLTRCGEEADRARLIAERTV